MTEDAWGKKLWDYRKNLGVSRKKFAETLGINEGTLRSYETLQRKPGFETYQKIESIINKTEEQRGDEYMNELLRTKDKLIESLEREKRLLERLNERDDAIQSPVYNNAADVIFQFDVKFNWSASRPGLKVRYRDDGGNYVPMMSAKLGYTHKELKEMLMIGEMVDYSEHRIHELRSKEEKKKMVGLIRTYLTAYSKIKMNTTMLIAEVPVLYNDVNGVSHLANVEYRVNWLRGNGSAHIRWVQDDKDRS